MTPSVFIRPAVQSDISPLIPLFEALDEQHRMALPDVFRRPGMERREQAWFDWILTGSDRAILVAEGVDKQIHGLVVLIAKSTPAHVVMDARRFVEIDQLIVGVGARRSGVGRSLLEASETWAREQGISWLESPHGPST